MAEKLNGLDVKELGEVLRRVREDPSTVQQVSRWLARVRWVEGFRVKGYVRNFEIKFDEPDILGGAGTAPNPVEYALSALGACLTIGFVLNATARGVRIRDLEIALEGDLDNVLVFFGLSDKGHPGYREVRLKAYVDADAPEDVLREIWEHTVMTSPVGNTFTQNVNLVTEFKKYA
jgi:uncharacterized OsmC-like protein